MVNLNEIKLNNWFYHNPSEWSYRNDDGVISNHGLFNADCFQWSENDWYALMECTLSIDAVEPIKSTKDWLVNLGFEKCGEIYNFTNDLKYFIERDINNDFTLRSRISKEESCFICSVKFVHNLQNAMFVLRNEELTFKIIDK